MTTQQASALAIVHSYKEEPGVKKLRKGYKLLPKEALSGLSSIMIDVVAFTIIYSIVAALVVYAFSNIINASAGWVTVVIAVMSALGIACLSQICKPVISWMRHNPNSPIVINKNQRATIKQARLLAKQLGERAVPVLTIEHISAIQMVQTHIALAVAANTTGEEEITVAPHDNDRLTVLLLEDINREPLLINLIQDRGLTSMDDLEKALREIETDTIGPIQSGWL